jgi:quinolinate synthase
MIALMHPECSFQNISGGEVTASAKGLRQFRELAETAKTLFSTDRRK